MNVGVRFGSALTMCSVFSSTVSASRCAIGTSAPFCVRVGRRAPPTSCSSWRRVGSVRLGLAVDVERRRVVEVDVERRLAAGSSAPRFALTSPIWFAGHGVTAVSDAVRSACRLSAPGLAGSGEPVPPAKWSPSSTVTTKSVLLLSIPSCLRVAVKNVANASS